MVGKILFNTSPSIYEFGWKNYFSKTPKLTKEIAAIVASAEETKEQFLSRKAGQKGLPYRARKLSWECIVGVLVLTLHGKASLGPELIPYSHFIYPTVGAIAFHSLFEDIGDYYRNHRREIDIQVLTSRLASCRQSNGNRDVIALKFLIENETKLLNALQTQAVQNIACKVTLLAMVLFVLLGLPGTMLGTSLAILPPSMTGVSYIAIKLLKDQGRISMSGYSETRQALARCVKELRR